MVEFKGEEVDRNRCVLLAVKCLVQQLIDVGCGVSEFGEASADQLESCSKYLHVNEGQ